jgi:nucleoid-associated protein YgaU
VLVVVALMAALTFVSVAYGAASNASESPGAPTTRSVVVRSGQTLWSLAGQALPGIDPREAVSLVAGLNGLGTGAQLHPGQSLRIPLSG